jgi:DNA polymerase-3 subunit beta
LKLTINKNTINKILKITNSIISNYNINPLLDNFLLIAEQNTLTVICGNQNNDKLKFVIREGFEIVKEGKILLKSKILSKIVTNLKNEKIVLEKVEENTLKINNSTFEAEIVLLKTNEYFDYQFNLSEEENVFNLSYDQIQIIIDKMSHAILVNNNLTNSVMNNIHFLSDVDNKKLKLSATDGFKISFLELDFDVNLNLDFIINIEILKRVMNLSSKNSDIRMSIKENNVYFEFDGILIFSSLVVGQFPNVENFFINNPIINFSIDKNELLNSLEKGSIFVIKEDTPIVDITIEKNQMIINFKSLEIGSSVETLNIKNHIGDRIKILLNVNYLSSILKAFENDIVKFEIESYIKPIIIKDEKNISFKQLISPIRY